jgi:hypothetical protein
MVLGSHWYEPYPAFMTKAERIKEEIGWYKVLSGVLAALDASLIAWLVQNFEAAKRIIVLGAALALPLVSCALAAVIWRLYRSFKLLEPL